MKRVFRDEELLRGSTEGREEIYKPRDAHGDTDKRQYEEQCVDDESQKQFFPDLFNRTLYGVELRVLLFELFKNFLIHKKRVWGMKNSLHTKLRLGFLGKARRIPWRVKGEFDIDGSYSGNCRYFFFHFVFDGLKKRAPNGSERHSDVYGAIVENDIINKTQIYN